MIPNQELEEINGKHTPGLSFATKKFAIYKKKRPQWYITHIRLPCYIHLKRFPGLLCSGAVQNLAGIASLNLLARVLSSPTPNIIIIN